MHMPNTPYSVQMTAAAKAELDRLGLTQKRVAEIVGENQPNISKWLNPGKLRNVDRVADLIRAVGGNPLVLLRIDAVANHSPVARWIIEHVEPLSDDDAGRAMEVLRAHLGADPGPMRDPRAIACRHLLDQVSPADLDYLLALLRSMAERVSESRAHGA